eukprot:scaffold71990_cov65-Phaeocystis_antarctica.AAC.8
MQPAGRERFVECALVDHAAARHLGARRRRIGDFSRASRPHRNLRSDPGRCSVASQVRSAARSPESPPQEAKVAGRWR